LRAIVDGDGRARLTGPQGSGILTSMAHANALLIVPADMPTVPAGTELEAILLDDPRHVAAPPY
jgi:molybdopterin molybdotransferase